MVAWRRKIAEHKSLYALSSRDKMEGNGGEERVLFLISDIWGGTEVRPKPSRISRCGIGIATLNSISPPFIVK
jgi:hypothetical protein